MYPVAKYLSMLKLAKRSPGTIRAYRNRLLSFSRFLGVLLDELHNHLSPDDLIRYAESLGGQSENGTSCKLSTMVKFFDLNGIKFDSMEVQVLKARNREEPGDKALELETLQKMMDLSGIHMKAILSVLISTGMRGGECCQLLLSDVKGDTIHIRNEIAKGKRGGDVYLTAEAREFLDIWLRERDAYIRFADEKTRPLHNQRPDNDQRLFACSYTSMYWKFNRLYMKIDGEKGKYGNKLTPHSTRKYFRTHAVKTIPLDLVEKIMRHSGYLTDSYVRISDEEARKQFHAGESALYITRKDHRIAQTEIDVLRHEKEELEAALSGRMTLMEKRMEELTKKRK